MGTRSFARMRNIVRLDAKRYSCCSLLMLLHYLITCFFFLYWRIFFSLDQQVLVLELQDNTPMLWILLNRACTTSRLSCYPWVPKLSRMGVVKNLGGDSAGTTDLNWPKEYFIPCVITLRDKSSGKELRQDVHGYGVCLPKQLLRVLRPCFPWSGWAFACWWEAVNGFLFLLFFL